MGWRRRRVLGTKEVELPTTSKMCSTCRHCKKPAQQQAYCRTDKTQKVLANRLLMEIGIKDSGRNKNWRHMTKNRQRLFAD